jgi:hypothetical protein
MPAPRKTAAVKQPTDHQAPTPAKGWKKAGAVLTLPSGNTMRLKNPGIMELAHQGLIPNALMATIMTSVQKGQEPTADSLMEGVEVQDMFDMMANAIISMAVEPEIHPIPEAGEPRDPELLYIDEMDEPDKMFIWQWATGGTDDVEQFRRESGDVLAALSGQQAVAQKPQRTPARKR